MEDIKKEIELLTEYGNVGYYRFCEVTQIVLLSKQDRRVINYFTNVDFSSKYTIEKASEYLTDKPRSVNDNFKIAVSTSIISIDEFKRIYFSAMDNGTWEFNDGTVVLDDIFPTGKKYVPASDPTGGQYGLVVPIEKSLYGSNFIGNYYLQELFSKKTILSNLDLKSRGTIFSVMKKCKLNYNLERLSDRVGNVVCKFKAEVIQEKPISLGAERGIELKFSINSLCQDKHRYSLQVLQEHDGLIYDNKLVEDYDCNNVIIAPNQCKNTVTIFDKDTGLISFSEVFDYTCRSSYHSQITPPYVIAQASHKTRRLLLNGIFVDVALSSVSMMGDVYYFIETERANIRKQKWDDEYFKEQNYFISYTTGQHAKAIDDIRKIINGNLIWDVQEICIIDPYLSANDILDTVVYSKKEGIDIKCLCDYSALHGNPETKNQSFATHFSVFKQKSKDLLSNALADVKDLNIEYRGVYGNSGAKFHDRFLILKFELNKTRVWSLGASVNSIGSKHSIIQIVEAPEIIVSLFDELWQSTSDVECQIFKQEAETT